MRSFVPCATNTPRRISPVGENMRSTTGKPWRSTAGNTAGRWISIAFVQYHLHLQLSDACAYAHSRGVILKGDLPIGVSPTSADAWFAPRLFNMDSQAGAPPDAFSAFGQNWGFPTYDWKRMAGDSFGWWKSRLAKMSEYFDAFRIDHILGFFRIWEIPVDSVRGLFGAFQPCVAVLVRRTEKPGVSISPGGRFVTPCVSERMLDEIFGAYAQEVQSKYVGEGRLAASCSTQRKIAARFRADDEHDRILSEGLMRLTEEVLFVEDPRKRGGFIIRGSRPMPLMRIVRSTMPRAGVSMRCTTNSFYRRHNACWRDSAMSKAASAARLYRNDGLRRGSGHDSGLCSGGDAPPPESFRSKYSGCPSRPGSFLPIRRVIPISRYAPPRRTT